MRTAERDDSLTIDLEWQYRARSCRDLLTVADEQIHERLICHGSLRLMGSESLSAQGL
jgi:hypothetical protein